LVLVERILGIVTVWKERGPCYGEDSWEALVRKLEGDDNGVNQKMKKPRLTEVFVF
jgi:hypothetical protein